MIVALGIMVVFLAGFFCCALLTASKIAGLEQENRDLENIVGGFMNQ